MGRYLTTRLIYSLLVILGVSAIVFTLGRLSGDPASLMLPMNATIEQRAALSREMGFDQPILTQYGRYLGQLLQGDFGDSIRFRRPAIDVFLGALPATLQLAGASMLLAITIGLPLGIAGAARRNQPVDIAAMVFTALGQAIPSFWLGIMLMLVFAVQLHWLPPSGSGTLAHLLMPAFTLSLKPMVTIARLTRSSLLEVLPADFIRTARAKGLAETRLLFRHALKPALIPVLTVMGIQLGYMLGGAVITEQIFGWPGIGRLAITAINTRDFPLLQTITLVGSATVVIINLVVDLLYSVVDPRIRYGGDQ